MWNYVFSHIPSAQPPLTVQRPRGVKRDLDSACHKQGTKSMQQSRKYTPEVKNCQTTVLLLCLGNSWANPLDLLQHFDHGVSFSPHCEKFQPPHVAPFPFLSVSRLVSQQVSPWLAAGHRNAQNKALSCSDALPEHQGCASGRDPQPPAAQTLQSSR